MSAQTTREDSFVCILYYLEGTDKAFKLSTIDTCSVLMMLLQYAFFAFAAKISIFEKSKKINFLMLYNLFSGNLGSFLTGKYAIFTVQRINI